MDCTQENILAVEKWASDTLQSLLMPRVGKKPQQNTPKLPSQDGNDVFADSRTRVLNVKRSRFGGLHVLPKLARQSVVMAELHRLQRDAVAAEQRALANATDRLFSSRCSQHEEAAAPRAVALPKRPTITQRDLFYRLVGHFPDQVALNRTVQEVSKLLGTARSGLGVVAGSRGFLAGHAILPSDRDGPLDVAALPYGIAIDGEWVCLADAPPLRSDEDADIGTSGDDEAALTKEEDAAHSAPEQHRDTPPHPTFVGRALQDPRFFVQRDARYLILVEKEAIFQRLVSERLHDRLPCLLVTGRGFPDASTRATASFAYRTLLANHCGPADADGQDLCRHQPRRRREAAAGPRHRPAPVRVLALVDWNPSGLLIMLQYAKGAAADVQKHPSKKSHSVTPAIPCIEWAGVRRSHLPAALVPGSTAGVSKLTKRDEQLAISTASTVKALADSGGLSASRASSWCNELKLMRELGAKAELESLYSEAGQRPLSDLVMRLVLHCADND